MMVDAALVILCGTFMYEETQLETRDALEGKSGSGLSLYFGEGSGLNSVSSIRCLVFNLDI